MREARPAASTWQEWCLRTATVLAVLTLGVSLVVAVAVGRELARKDACHAPLEFEVESAETVRTAWFPPSATCEYRVLGRPVTRTEPRWEVYSPVVPTLALAASLSGLVTLRRRRRAGYVQDTPVPPTPQ